MAENIASVYELQDQLYERGLNLAKFARQNGFEKATVHRTVHHYWGVDRVPRGVLSRRILRKLKEILSQPPAVVSPIGERIDPNGDSTGA